MSQPDHEHPPIEFTPMKHGEFCWTEIASTDAAGCMEFYSNVFGWKFKKDDAAGGMAYNEFATGDRDQPVGGLYQIDPSWFGDDPPPPHFMSYVMVDDVDETTRKAAQLGATIIRGPMDVQGIGRMSVLADPTGAHISLFRWKAK
jgi:predicted enzyme related to lactoylglutathione lyase